MTEFEVCEKDVIVMRDQYNEAMGKIEFLESRIAPNGTTIMRVRLSGVEGVTDETSGLEDA